MFTFNYQNKKEVLLVSLYRWKKWKHRNIKSLDLGFTVFEWELGFRPIAWARACVPSYPLLSLRGEGPIPSLTGTLLTSDPRILTNVLKFGPWVIVTNVNLNHLLCAVYGNVDFNRQVCRRASTDCGHVFLLSPPECLYVFPCHWNYRPDHCMYGSNCKRAELEGVSVLHGNRGVYHDDKQPTFKALYEAIRDVSMFLLPFSRHVLTARSSVGALVIFFFEGQILPHKHWTIPVFPKLRN